MTRIKNTITPFFLAFSVLLVSTMPSPVSAGKSADTSALNGKNALAKIDGARLWRAPDHTRVVFDLSGPVEHSMFQLANPNRVVLDITGVSLKADLDGLDLKGSPIVRIRTGQTENGIRLVFDSNQKVEPVSFSLAKLADKQDRLVIDFIDTTSSSAGNSSSVAESESATAISRDAANVKTPSLESEISAVEDPKKLAEPSVLREDESSPFLIAIDAGHGGEDPGASGPKKTREKDVVFQIASELKSRLDKHPAFKSHMVRTGDYYIPLRDRRNSARLAKADLFISIHADAFTHPRAHGASVFALSRSGATSEMARFLASKENEADLIGGVGGVSLEDKDAVLAGVLVDLSMSSTLEKSLLVGTEVLSEIGSFTKLHKRSVEQAGFAVLKSPDVPSILVETGFISNPEEERKLRSKKHQKKIAQAIVTGVDRFFKQYNPSRYKLSQENKKSAPSKAIAKISSSQSNKTAESSTGLIQVSSRANESSGVTVHIVRSGDTLSQIARQYNKSLKSIIRKNQLSDTRLKVGQKILIDAE